MTARVRWERSHRGVAYAIVDGREVSVWVDSAHLWRALVWETPHRAWETRAITERRAKRAAVALAKKLGGTHE